MTICKNIATDSETTIQFKFSCGACIDNKRGARCIHFENFLNPTCTSPTTLLRELFYLIKTQGRGPTSICSFFRLQLDPRQRFTVDEKHTPRCDHTGEFCFRCHYSCCKGKDRALHINEFPELRVVHTWLDQYLDAAGPGLNDNEKKERERLRVYVHLQGEEPFPYVGGVKARRALRLCHKETHPELYLDRNLNAIYKNDDALANGDSLTDRVQNLCGFDARSELRGKTGRVQLNYKNKVGMSKHFKHVQRVTVFCHYKAPSPLAYHFINVVSSSFTSIPAPTSAVASVATTDRSSVDISPIPRSIGWSSMDIDRCVNEFSVSHADAQRLLKQVNNTQPKVLQSTAQATEPKRAANCVVSPGGSLPAGPPSASLLEFLNSMTDCNVPLVDCYGS